MSPATATSDGACTTATSPPWSSSSLYAEEVVGSSDQVEREKTPISMMNVSISIKPTITAAFRGPRAVVHTVKLLNLLGGGGRGSSFASPPARSDALSELRRRRSIGEHHVGRELHSRCRDDFAVAVKVQSCFVVSNACPLRRAV